MSFTLINRTSTNLSGTYQGGFPSVTKPFSVNSGQDFPAFVPCPASAHGCVVELKITTSGCMAKFQFLAAGTITILGVCPNITFKQDIFLGGVISVAASGINLLTAGVKTSSVDRC